MHCTDYTKQYLIMHARTLYIHILHTYASHALYILCMGPTAQPPARPSWAACMGFRGLGWVWEFVAGGPGSLGGFRFL